MSMYFGGDTPWYEAERREMQWDAFVRTCPQCAQCGEHITQGEITRLRIRNDEYCFCSDCVQSNTRDFQEEIDCAS